MKLVVAAGAQKRGVNAGAIVREMSKLVGGGWGGVNSGVEFPSYGGIILLEYELGVRLIFNACATALSLKSLLSM